VGEIIQQGSVCIGMVKKHDQIPDHIIIKKVFFVKEISIDSADFLKMMVYPFLIQCMGHGFGHES
jgi:hypothetical protein